MSLFGSERMRRRVAAIEYLMVSACLAGAIAGCAATPPRTSGAVARPEPAAAKPAAGPETVDELLLYGHRLEALPSQALTEEYARAAGALAEDPSAANRIRVALLLSRPGTSFRDDKRAQALLKQVTADARYPARRYHGLASFLALTLDDRQRVEAALAEERRQRQDLQNKLEQLKAIELELRIPAEPIKGK